MSDVNAYANDDDGQRRDYRRGDARRGNAPHNGDPRNGGNGGGNGRRGGSPRNGDPRGQGQGGQRGGDQQRGGGRRRDGQAYGGGNDAPSYGNGNPYNRGYGNGADAGGNGNGRRRGGGRGTQQSYVNNPFGASPFDDGSADEDSYNGSPFASGSFGGNQYGAPQYGNNGDSYSDDGQPYDDAPYSDVNGPDMNGQYDDSQYSDDGQPYDDAPYPDVNGPDVNGQYDDSQYSDDGQPYDDALYSDDMPLDTGGRYDDANGLPSGGESRYSDANGAPAGDESQYSDSAVTHVNDAPADEENAPRDADAYVEEAPRPSRSASRPRHARHSSSRQDAAAPNVAAQDAQNVSDDTADANQDQDASGSRNKRSHASEDAPKSASRSRKTHGSAESGTPNAPSTDDSTPHPSVEKPAAPVTSEATDTTASGDAPVKSDTSGFNPAHDQKDEPIEIDETVSEEELNRYSEAFRAERANRVAMRAATTSGILPAATSLEGLRALPRDFSVELKQGSITDQRHSGRCWLFASLNVMRYELMHRWNLDDFEFSENYLFFWDKIEKSNVYLDNVLATLNETYDSRLFQAINEAPADDGGWWQMFVGLVDKYGIVPANAYPESANSRNSDAFVQYLTTALRSFAADLRRRYVQGEDFDSLLHAKEDYMEQVYRMACIALGEPPSEFTFSMRTKDTGDAKKDKDSDADATQNGDAQQGDGTEKYDGRDKRKRIVDGPLSPIDFAVKYLPMKPDDYVTLCNAPMEDTPFWKRYMIRWSTNVAGTPDMTFINVPIDTLKAAAVAQLQAGHPLWFACDCTQYALRDKGVFDQNTVRVDELFGIDLPYDKGIAIAYGDAQSNHAMTLTGVNIGADGKPDRWKVENSWGKNSGQDGYYVASDAWFDRYVTELVVHKDYLDKKTLKLVDAKPVVLDPWQPLTAPCR